ncbi:hypothetical protein L1887_38181 [Cichorium endivia]|nr:hypothetical protein L1887_38181 [Cichorium endivia]
MFKIIVLFSFIYYTLVFWCSNAERYIEVFILEVAYKFDDVGDLSMEQKKNSARNTCLKNTKLPTWNKAIFTNYSPLGTQLELGLDPPSSLFTISVNHKKIVV